MSRQEIDTLVKRALFLEERIALYRQSPDSFNSPLADSDLIAQWSDYLGGAERLDERLSRQNLSRSDIPRILAGPSVWNGDIPDWAAFWQDKNGGVQLRPAMSARSDLTEIPFAALLEPLAAAVFEPFRMAALKQVTAGALDDLFVALLKKLSRLSAPALHREFEQFAARQDGRRLFFSPEELEIEGDAHYRAFVEFVRETGFARAMGEYPVLLRLLASLAQSWTRASLELLQRVESDRSALSQHFGAGAALGCVARIELGLSDSHHGSRSVARITFESGLQLIYKPRDIGIEAAWFDLIEFLDRGREIRQKTLKTLPRDGYGWVECVLFKDCADEAAARRYYVRCGELLALLYALSATDCHYENLIAHGEFPVIVDLETLLHPPAHLWAVLPRTSHVEELDTLLSSVLTTGLLPVGTQDAGGRVIDASALGATEAVERGALAWKCLSPGTDRMRVVFEPVELVPEANVCRLRRRPLSAADYLEELLAGFRSGCRAIMAQRQTLLSEGGLIERLAGCMHRLLLRESSDYALVLNRMIAPENLADGVRFELCAEALARSWLAVSDRSARERAFNIFLAEKRALVRMDVPHFSAAGHSLALMDNDDVVILDFLWTDTLTRIRERLNKLDENDINFQEQLTREAFRARFNSVIREAATPGMTPQRAVEECTTPCTAGELVAEAERIGGQIKSHAIPTADGHATWLVFGTPGAQTRASFGPMSSGFYEGRLGVGVFLANLYACTGDKEWKRLALQAVRPLSNALKGRRPALEGIYGLGIAAGVGGAIYGLSVAEALLDEALLGDAATMGELLDEASAQPDGVRDVMGGATGALIGLLAAPAYREADYVLDRLVRVGDELLASRTVTRTGHRAWRGSQTGMEALTGFAHGASGFAFALMRMAKCSGERRFKEAAIEALLYENALRTEHGAWPDLRSPSKPGAPPMSGWCAGAPGIGFTRSLAARMKVDVAMRDLDAAVSDTLAASTNCIDSLCCGRAARVLFLCHAAKFYAAPDAQRLLFAASAHASYFVRATPAAWRFSAGVSGRICNPGLFQGWAGVGLALLKSARPELPDLLMFNGD